MTRRLLGVLAIFVIVEVAVFYWRHHDVVRLSLSRDMVIADPAFPDEATAVLAGDRVSRRVLERIADVAQVRGEHDLRVRALERIAADFPDDAQVRLRLAQALRDAGRLEEAERIYRAELGLSPVRP
jgi:thioredoxin-like negative regulator of GroEL